MREVGDFTYRSASDERGKSLSGKSGEPENQPPQGHEATRTAREKDQNASPWVRLWVRVSDGNRRKPKPRLARAAVVAPADVCAETGDRPLNGSTPSRAMHTH
jgi:hypothetical protein